jgi:hypothetical protein
MKRRAKRARRIPLEWLHLPALTGIAAGILWWLLAPGGALYGDGTDIASWFPRDATLAILLLLAGAAGGVAAIRRRPRAAAGVLMLALVVGGFAGSVIAWRMGVFAGDLFRTPPANMPNPSIVFSLRSGPVLLLWPLVSVLVFFVWNLFTYAFHPMPEEPVHSTGGVNG